MNANVASSPSFSSASPFFDCISLAADGVEGVGVLELLVLTDTWLLSNGPLLVVEGLLPSGVVTMLVAEEPAADHELCESDENAGLGMLP